MQTVYIKTKPCYDVLIGKQILTILPTVIKSAGEYSRVAIITDDIVDSLYGETVRESLKGEFEVSTFVFPNGENSKNYQTLLNIYEFLCKNHITRWDLIIALGGGVVGDISGYAAATYQRGIDYVQIPTTFLAAIDSSVGGKTAINLSFGKNLVGAFWQPKAVLCDINTLSTLTKERYLDGLSEAIKYGVTYDSQLYSDIEHMEEHQLGEIIRRCVEIKAKVVSQDTHDKGLRQILNFGHTIGHAIEKDSNFGISHGQAVAIGMAMITKWSESEGYTKAGTYSRLKATLVNNHLPTDYIKDIKALLPYISSDKKRKGDGITIVLLEEIGHCYLKEMTFSALEASL